VKNCTLAPRAIVVPVLALISAAGIVGAGASSVPWSAAERIATGFQFTEGPVWHPDGFLLLSDVQGNRIVKWTAPDETETFRQPSGNSNGLVFDQQGRLVACEHSNRRVSRTELTGKIAALASMYDNKRLNSPNDLAIKSDGSIYFTDPPYGISGGQQELPFNGVFRISPEGELTLLSDDFDRPNGLAFSPDEEKLYIADTTMGHVRVFDVQPDGTLTGGSQFVQVASPDGMKVDRKGKLYVASASGVAVFSASGETIGTIAFPEQPSNCCFGDADGKTLFVTARTSLYRVILNDSEIGVDGKGRVTVTWSSLPGKTYAVYRSGDMVAWELADDGVPSDDGTATTWTDLTGPLLSPEVERRYYRVGENE
jgi:sugar lactone lactonase YvrE